MSPLRILIAVVFLVAASAWQRFLPAEDRPAAIRIGLPTVGVGGRPLIGGSVIATVHGKQLLEQAFTPLGIMVEWSLNKGAGPVVNEQLANHQLDFACYGDLAAIIGKGVGIHSKLLLAGGRGGNIYLAVRADSPFHAINDLLGKRLVVFKGTAIQLLASRLLAQRGLGEADFRSVVLDTTAAIPALLSGDVEAAWGISTILEFVQRGDLRIVASSREAPPAADQQRPTFANVLVVDEDFASRYPSIVQQVVTIFVREAAWASDEANRDEVFRLWARSGTPEAVYRQDFDGDTLSSRNSPLLDTGFRASFQAGIDRAREYKLVRAPVDLATWIDAHFLDQALRDLSLVDHWVPTDALGHPLAIAHPAH
jgi:sulfonate transport system substrate-binding protein